MANLIAEYQSLLTADESLATLDRAVDLAQRVARGHRVVDRQRWPALPGVNGGTQTSSVPSALARRVLDVANLLQSLPELAEKPDVPEAQYALLMDTLVLVFHQAYFSLLPKAASHRKTLLQAFDVFATELPNLADRFQTKGLVHLERGEFGQAVQAFNGALAATPADQHDFMTRLHMLWSLLIEHHRVQDAFDCLMEVSPRITRLDYDEFKGLLKETFEISRRR